MRFASNKSRCSTAWLTSAAAAPVWVCGTSADMIAEKHGCVLHQSTKNGSGTLSPFRAILLSRSAPLSWSEHRGSTGRLLLCYRKKRLQSILCFCSRFEGCPLFCCWAELASLFEKIEKPTFYECRLFLFCGFPIAPLGRLMRFRAKQRDRTVRTGQAVKVPSRCQCRRQH